MTVYVVIATKNWTNTFPKILVCEIYEDFDKAFDRQHELIAQYRGDKTIGVLMSSKNVIK